MGSRADLTRGYGLLHNSVSWPIDGILLGHDSTEMAPIGLTCDGVQVLTKQLGGLLSSLQFLKSMRWNSATSFSRPVRWLLALHGTTVLPFSFAGLQAGPVSQGPRNVGSFAVSSAEDYRYGNY